MSPRCPLPMGETRSMIRGVTALGVVSRRSCSWGHRGVSLANSGRRLERSASMPLTVSTLTMGLYLTRPARF